MSDVKWTTAQRAAIDSRGNTLVSAAAGSGKTAALTAKIMHLLDTVPDATLEDFLIVTFTKAAAGELRERVGKLLSESACKGGAAARMRELASADICTIHSFCMKLLRANFTAVGISPDVAVADETTANVMKARAMEDTVDDLFRGELPLTGENICTASALADSVGRTRDAAGLDAELRVLYDRLRSRGQSESALEDYAQRLEACACGDFFASPWGEEIKAHTVSAARHYLGAVGTLIEEMSGFEAVREKYVPAAEALHSFLLRVAKAAEGGTYEDVRAALDTYEAVTLGRLSAKDKTDASERFKAIRDKAKKEITKLANRYYSATSEAQSEAMVRTAGILRGAARVLAVYGKRYEKLKHDRGVLDFADLETLALKLLESPDGTPTAAAREIGRKYRFVFIDEYQDTNSVQDRIFRAVSESAEKFFVGDIKQSIYRFRGAEPEVFSGYRRAWAEADPEAVSRGEWTDTLSEECKLSGLPAGKSIFMSENFRCARPVIDFVNAVSRVTFPYGGVPFTESDCLIWGTVAMGDAPVEVCLIDGSARRGEDEDAPRVSESEYAAYRIGELIRRGEARVGDIAILLRNANSDGGKYEAALTKLGIPVKVDGGSPFSEESEVVLTLNILRAVDNPSSDIPLAGAMLSSVFGFSMEDMVKLRLGNEKCTLYEAVCRRSEGVDELSFRLREFITRLESLRRAEVGMSADRFLLHLYSECDLFSCEEVSEKPCGRENLNTLHHLAKTYESGVFGGLYGFLRFVDEKLEGGELKSASGAARDGVTVMSIHKSKGLEFPVCFLCGCGGKRNESDERAGVLTDRELGVGLRLPDPGGLVLCGNGVRDAVALRLSMAGAMEEMRVLYVALTRARDRLIVTAKTSASPESELEAAAEAAGSADSYSVLTKKRMIDHILSANALQGGICRITRVAGTLDTAYGETVPAEGDFEEDKELSLPDVEKVRDAISFVYPYAHLQSLPSKLAVSKLYPSLLDERDEPQAASVLPELTEDVEAAPEERGEMPKPRFMTGTNDTSPAERGTSTHVFLQFADLGRVAEHGVRAELSRLTEKGFITPTMASLVNIRQIEHMAHSPFAERLRAARRVVREYRFNVAISAARFTENEELRRALEETGESVTVQGVFDCVFEDADGRLVLADYKTDSLTSYELTHPEAARRKLIERHRRQLTYYAEAVRLLFSREPDEVLIYSTALGEAVKVDISPRAL